MLANMAPCGGLISPRSLLLLLGLLLCCSLLPASAVATEGRPAGATMATATQLVTGDSYRATLTSPGGQSWYRLEVSPGAFARFALRGETSSCPVRATMLNAGGRPLGEIVSTTRETLAFVVNTPSRATSETYYVRLDPAPACTAAGYLLRQIEPFQEVCESSSSPTPLACPTTPTSPTPTTTSPTQERLVLISSGCKQDGRALRVATSTTERERRRLAGHRNAVAILRRLERAEQLLNQRTIHACGGY
jgi:hypothetical protein